MSVKGCILGKINNKKELHTKIEVGKKYIFFYKNTRLSFAQNLRTI